MATPPPPTSGMPPADAEHSKRERARLVAIAILAVAATLFAVLNLDEVKVHLLFGTPELPLIIVIVACLAIGTGIGWALARRRHAS